MNTVKATVLGGRVELDEPLDLPDGTVLVIPLPNGTSEDTEDEEWDNSPQGVADWLQWYESLKPLNVTLEEEADTDAWLKKMDQYSAANIGKGTENLFR